MLINSGILSKLSNSSMMLLTNGAMGSEMPLNSRLKERLNQSFLSSLCTTISQDGSNFMLNS